MERRIAHSFILLGILIVTSVFVFSYANLRFTGFAVSPSGCDGNWTNITDVCINGTQSIIWNSNDTTNCNSSVIESQICVISEENLTASNESLAENQTLQNEINSNLTSEENLTITSCGDGIIQTPNSDGTNESCDDGLNNGQACTAEYESSCTYCSSDCQSQTVQGASCGDGNCDSNEDCSSCENDCGACEENTSDNTDNTNEQIATTEVTCTSNWQCGDWQECINETQIRICTDLNECGSNSGMPQTSQTCVVPIIANCSDGIKNQNETSVDCGGPCKKCGFFTIVGSAVSGTFDAGTKFVFEGMFGNFTKTLISIGVFAFIIGGFVMFRFFYRVKNARNNLPIQKQETKDEDESDEDDSPVDYSKFETY